MKISNIPSEFIEEYNQQTFAHNGWVYFEIFRGCYGLPQIINLSNYLMRKRLKKSRYFEAATTLGLQRHTQRPIQFCLINDYFGIEYAGGKHAHHLRQVLQEYYEISEYWKETNFQALTWNGIIPPSTMTTHAASISKDILKKSFYGLTTRDKPNLSSHPTSIAKFTMEPKNKWPHQKWKVQALTLKV